MKNVSKNMRKKKTFVVIATGVAIVIFGLISTGFNPLSLYFGARITGDVEVYQDGEQVNLGEYRLICTMSGDGREVVQSTDKGTLFFWIRGREYGDYDFRLVSDGGETHDPISNYYFSCVKDDTSIYEMHYTLTIDSKEKTALMALDCTETYGLFQSRTVYDTQSVPVDGKEHVVGAGI